MLSKLIKTIYRKLQFWWTKENWEIGSARFFNIQSTYAQLLEMKHFFFQSRKYIHNKYIQSEIWFLSNNWTNLTIWFDFHLVNLRWFIVTKQANYLIDFFLVVQIHTNLPLKQSNKTILHNLYWNETFNIFCSTHFFSEINVNQIICSFIIQPIYLYHHKYLKGSNWKFSEMP